MLPHPSADVVIEEGCSIQGSVVGKGAVLQARATRLMRALSFAVAFR